MDLLVKASFNVNTNLLTLTDLIARDYNTTYGYTLADVKGLFRITGPSGIVYQNPGWDTEDYSSPDIEGSSLDWVKDGISVPVDSDTLMQTGVYQVEYMVTLDGTGTTTFSFDKSYTHSYIAVTASITSTIFTSLSYMIVSDETTYTVVVNGISYIPTNTIADTRVLLARWPAGSGVSDSSTALANLQLGPNLWTGSYDLILTSDVVYELAADTGLTAEIVDVISGVDDSVEVHLDECTTVVYECLVNLTADYEQAKKYNLPKAQELRKNLFDIDLYYGMYNMAVKLGEDTAYAKDILYKLIVANGCSAEVTEFTESEEMLPAT